MSDEVKNWKVSDRVCFAHQQLGQVFHVTRVHDEEPLVEIAELPGLYASHIFVAAPAEPISLPPPTVEAKKDSSEGQHPARTIAGADRPGPASPADPGARCTEISDRSAPESPALAQLLPVLTTIATELTKIRNELSVRNSLAGGDGRPD